MKPYFERSGIVIYHARCEDVLPTLPSGGVVITDPPYSEHVHGNVRSGTTLKTTRHHGVKRELDFDHLSPELRRFCAEQFARIAGRWVLTFTDCEGAQAWRDDLVSAGLEYIRTGAWVKVGGTPQFSGDRPGQGHEELVIAHPQGRKRWNGGGKAAVYITPIVLGWGRQIRGEPRLHRTQKPIRLMRQLMADFTEPGELVIDPFAGIGSTGRACLDLGRRCVMVEMDEANCEKAARRFEQQVLPLGAD